MTQISKINGISVVDTKVTGFTYDGVNIHTITDNEGTEYSTTMNSFSATTISATTFFGDGSNLTGVGGSITGGTNIGNATEIFSGVNGSNLEFRTLTGATNEKITTAVSGDTIEIDINEPNLTLWPLVVNGNQLISGGATYLSGLTFDISALSYIIGSTIYAASASTVTLNSGDTSFDRIDVIYVDVSGNTGVVEGVPSANPAKPPIDGSSQVEVTFVTVSAGSAIPDVSITKIYDEDLGVGGGEWDYSATTAVRISGDSTNDSFSGTKSIEFISAVSNDSFTMGNPTPYDISSDNTLSFYIKNIVAWNNKKYIEITLLDASDNQIGIATLDDGLYGFTQAISGWQTIAIPLGAFNMTSNLVSKVRYTVKATGASSALELYIDLIRFQAGAGTSSPVNAWYSFVGDDSNITIADTSTTQLRLSGGTNITTAIDDTTKTAVFNLNDNISLSSVTATTISATTFYGDGSNLTGVGSFTSFDVSGDTGSQTIVDGDTIYYEGGEAIKTTASATDKLTIDLDITGTTAEATPSSGDKLIIYEAGSGTHKNIDWDDLPGAGGGEINTASNIGGGEGLFSGKTGVNLAFKSLTSTGGTVTFSSTGATVNLESAGGASRIEASVQTTNATITELEKIDTLTDNTTNIVEVYVKAYETAAAEYGVWKRTLTVTSVGGTVVIREENADVDKTSSGLNANSITFTVNGGDIDIDVTGIAATTIDWESAYEIIL